MKLNKKVIIFLIVIFIVVIIVGTYFYNKITSVVNDAIKENAYIDIWRDTSLDLDIDLYSTGSGANEKLYLGAQPIHYLINKKGKVYTYQASSYKNKITGKIDPATVKYIKTLSQSELQNLVNDLKLTIESNSSGSISFDSPNWYIEIDDNSTRVHINVQTSILNKYL